MQLRIKNGQLSYGSTYKLFYVGWVAGLTLFFGILVVPMLIMAAFGVPATVNGEVVTGLEAVGSIASFLLIFPIIIALQGLMFAGVMTLGIWLYRRWQPITITGQENTF